MTVENVWTARGLTCFAELHDRVVGLEACDDDSVLATLSDGSVVRLQLTDATQTLVSAPGGIN
jgi:hypothetical protein